VSTEHIPNSDLLYHLIAFDASGNERTDDADGIGSVMSRKTVALLAQEPITDVFLMCHGWQGDVPAAREQYGKWFGVMATQQADIDRIREIRPGFRPLVIGQRWPSLPWGDEEFGSGACSYGTPAAVSAFEELCDRYSERIAATPAARQALEPDAFCSS
jgi:hypothetical protein